MFSCVLVFREHTTLKVCLSGSPTVCVCGVGLWPYLGLEGPLQRAKGPGWRDHRWNAGHARGVGVEQLRKEEKEQREE